MKSRIWAATLAFALLIGGAGLLPESRAIEALKLVGTLAIDGDEEVSVTALTAVRASGEEEPETFSGTGGSLGEACRKLREGSARRTYLGQTEQLLLGEDCDLSRTLDFVLTDRELRMDTSLYIVRGNAGEALRASAERAGEETGGKDPRRRSVGEVLARLAEGENTLVPALAPDQDGTLVPAGWAAVDPRGVAGYLEGEAAMGALLLQGGGAGEVVTLPEGTAEVTGARLWARDGTLQCDLEARRIQGEPEIGGLETWAETRLRAALAAGWDCWGLDRELAAARPWNWETIRGTRVGGLDVKVTGKWVEGYGP